MTRTIRLPHPFGTLCGVDLYLKDESKLLREVGIEVLNGEIVRIVPEQKEGFLAGWTTYTWDKLIVATGAGPIASL